VRTRTLVGGKQVPCLTTELCNHICQANVTEFIERIYAHNEDHLSLFDLQLNFVIHISHQLQHKVVYKIEMLTSLKKL